MSEAEEKAEKEENLLGAVSRGTPMVFTWL